MAKKRKSKTKTKIVYRTPAQINEGYFGKEKKEEVQKDILALEEKRKITPKGFKGFIQKAQINKAISERRALLRTAKGAELTKIRTSAVESQVKLQEAQNKLQILRKANQVDFGGYGTAKKDLKLSDLY